MNLNSSLLDQLLELAANKLEGDWVLLGGTLLPALGIEIRTTVDVDLVSLSKNSNEQSLQLMEIAESLGLPIETINQAAAYFLEKTKYTPADLLPLKTGKTASIYRPTLLLFWKLKTKRLSESDFLDCQAYLEFSRKQGDEIPREALLHLLKECLNEENTENRVARLTALRRLLA